ncbi:unnamed protein product [Hydatigera taeniaeformis]|uniref:Mitochondrial carrier 2 n=1 Tax=Hydatigena taeniaeformis TaxID=6205 RepID=A0A158RF41_HYDTA|nr:unnamed protein product [Hydatigera taeniaeformis]
MSGVAISDGSVSKLCYDYVIPTAISTVCHPFVCARTLMMVNCISCSSCASQLGHEFEPPTLGRNIIGLQRYMYPNVFNYRMSLFCTILSLQLATCEKMLVSSRYSPWVFRPPLLVRLLSRLCVKLIYVSTLQAICTKNQYLRQKKAGKFLFRRCIPVFCIVATNYAKSQLRETFLFGKTCKLTAGRCLGLLVSYPFQGEFDKLYLPPTFISSLVIMIRQIAQLVGKETIYSNIFKAFVEINVNEGLPGLFGGLIPRLLGEVVTVWLTAGMAYLVNKYLLPADTDPFVKEQTPYVAGILVSSCTHRLTVTSTVMAVSGSGLSVAVPFKNSLDCYNYLSTRNAFMRGASLFFRYASGAL